MHRPSVGDKVEVTRSFPQERVEVGTVVSLLATQFTYELEDGSVKFCTYKSGDNTWKRLIG